MELHQYRIAVATRLLGIAGSELDPDERRLSAMQRELQEEAGYSPSQWDPLGAMLPCPGYSDQVIHLILARELQALVVRPSSDDEEDLAVLLKETTELEAGLSSGDEYLDSKSVSAWYGPRQLNRIEYCAKTLNHRSSVLT